MPSVVNKINFQREVLEAPCPVIVHFWTPWCGLCRLISPMLETIQADSNQLIKLVAINADENLKLANTYNLRNLPTVILFNNGELLEKLDNFNSRDNHFRLELETAMNNFNIL
jgi:thioredoxin 1